MRSESVTSENDKLLQQAATEDLFLSGSRYQSLFKGQTDGDLSPKFWEEVRIQDQMTPF